MEIKSFKSIIEQYPTVIAFAEEIGCNPDTARKMKQLNTIHAKYWLKLLESTGNRGIQVTCMDLIRFAAKG